MNRLTATGKYDLTVLDENGSVREHVEQSNRVVDSGLALIASLIAGSDNDPNYLSRPTHSGIGTVQNDVKPTDTKLIDEVFRKPCDKIVRTNNSIEFTTTFEPGEPNLERVRICETGLYNAETGGTLFNRCVFSQINKYNADTLIIKYNLTINAQETVSDNVDDTPDETPPETETIVTVTINQPANGRITVSTDGQAHDTTFQVVAGTVITIICEVNEGYQLDQLLYGGVMIDSGARRNVASNVTITANISEIPVTMYRVALVQPTYGVIIANDGTTDYASTFNVPEGMQVTFTVQPVEGFSLYALKVNSQQINVDQPLTITQDCTVTAIMSQQKPASNPIVNVGGDGRGIVVVNDGEEDHAFAWNISSNAFLTKQNAQLRVTATADAGYELQSLKYWYWGTNCPEDEYGNEIEINSGDTIIAKYNVTIDYRFARV